jgi:hypothetical protein
MRTIFFQCGDENSKALLDLVAPYHTSYCAQFPGVEYVRMDVPARADGRKNTWQKVTGIRDLLATLTTGDRVLYLDDDAVVVSRAVSITAAFSGVPLKMCRIPRAPWKGLNYNSGVIAMEVSDALKTWLAAVDTAGPLDPEERLRGDEPRINAMLDQIQFAALDARWNSFPNIPSSSPVISSFHGEPLPLKTSAITAIVKGK